jgi:hypothetical protein
VNPTQFVSTCILVLWPLTAASQPMAASAGGYRVEPVTVDGRPLAERFTPAQIAVLEKLNRRDQEHLLRLDEIVVPQSWHEDELAYSPLPATWSWAEHYPKALIVHQPAQVFGAYEWGQLVRWGPVSSGRKETPTPPGVFHLNWRSRSRRSTDNEAWLLEWYFNFVNARGISFHKFELPGYPASHACVRLLERDAIWMYDWGESWRLSPDGRTVITTGTPVVIHGEYDFERTAFWLSPDGWREPLPLPADPASR